MAQQQLQQHQYQTVSRSISDDRGIITYDDTYDDSSVSGSSKRLYHPDIDDYQVYANHHCINFSDDESYDFEAGVSFDNFLDNRKNKSRSSFASENDYRTTQENMAPTNILSISSTHLSQENHDLLSSSSAWILFNNNNNSKDEEQQFNTGSFAASARNKTNIVKTHSSTNPTKYEDILSSAGYSVDQISSTHLNRIKEEILHSEDDEREEIYSSEEDDGSMIKILKKEVRLLFPKQYLAIKDQESQDSKFIMIDQWQDNSSWNSLRLGASTYHYKSTAAKSNYMDLINTGTVDSADENPHRRMSFKEEILDRYPCGVYNYSKSYGCHKTRNKRMFYGCSKIIHLTQEDKRRLKQVMERIKPCSNTTISANKSILTSFVC